MKYVTIFAILLMAPVIVLSQGEPIGREEFFRVVNHATDATNAVPYRSETKFRRLADGPPTIEWTQTKNVHDRATSHLKQTEGDIVIEVISVGRKNYQRENGGKWRVVGTPENVYLGRTIGGPHTSEFFSEDAIIDGRKYSAFTWFILEINGRYSENTTFIGPDGRIFREVSRGGTSKVIRDSRQKNLVWDETTDYFYESSRKKIEAPIP